MKKTPKGMMEIFERNPELLKIITNNIEERKNLEKQKSTVSLPQSVIDSTKIIDEKWDLTKSDLMHLMVQFFTSLERNFLKGSLGGDALFEFIKSLEDHYFPNGLINEPLFKQSYLMNKNDAINIKIISRRLSMPRNTIISVFFMILSDQFRQYDESYDNHVRKYKKEFEKLFKAARHLKLSAMEDWDGKINQIALMAERLESHIQIQLHHIEKYQKEGIWYIGTSDSENVEYADLLKEIFE